jgi:glycerol-3-phosphate acyltransferase PlsY
MLYPNDAAEAHFDLVAVAARPVAAPVLWTALILWCLSWTFVMGHLTSTWAARHGRPSWATPALLLLGVASPLVFAVASPILIGLASRNAYRAESVISFLPAVLVQLAISHSYAFMWGVRPRAWPRQEGLRGSA